MPEGVARCHRYDDEGREDGRNANRGEGGKRKSGLCWPETLRAVRGWLEPRIMLNRYWRAFCRKPPPPELKALLEWVFSGQGLYLYVH